MRSLVDQAVQVNLEREATAEKLEERTDEKDDIPDENPPNLSTQNAQKEEEDAGDTITISSIQCSSESNKVSIWVSQVDAQTDTQTQTPQSGKLIILSREGLSLRLSPEKESPSAGKPESEEAAGIPVSETLYEEIPENPPEEENNQNSEPPASTNSSTTPPQSPAPPLPPRHVHLPALPPRPPPQALDVNHNFEKIHTLDRKPRREPVNVERTNRKNLFKYLGIEVPPETILDPEVIQQDPSLENNLKLEDKQEDSAEKNQATIINHYHLEPGPGYNSHSSPPLFQTIPRRKNLERFLGLTHQDLEKAVKSTSSSEALQSSHTLESSSSGDSSNYSSNGTNPSSSGYSSNSLPNNKPKKSCQKCVKKHSILKSEKSSKFTIPQDCADCERKCAKCSKTIRFHPKPYDSCPRKEIEPPSCWTATAGPGKKDFTNVSCCRNCCCRNKEFRHLPECGVSGGDSWAEEDDLLPCHAIQYNYSSNLDYRCESPYYGSKFFATTETLPSGGFEPVHFNPGIPPDREYFNPGIPPDREYFFVNKHQRHPPYNRFETARTEKSSAPFNNATFMNRYPIMHKSRDHKSSRAPKSRHGHHNSSTSPCLNPFGCEQVYIDMNSVIASQFCTMRTFKR